jgi:peptidyl-dipeptidase Dcp
MTNPLLSPFETSFGLPPFDVIETKHFGEALIKGLEEARAAIADIKSNSDAPTFANTIEAMELSEGTLDRVAAVFFNLSGTDATPEIEALMREWSPKFAAFGAEIMMDADLFARVDTVYATRNDADLTPEQLRVLELYHRNFLRAGAALPENGKLRLADIMQRLAALGTAFTQNVLADERDWSMTLSESDLDGLPRDVIAAARGAAETRGIDGYVITLNRSLIVPFLEYSTRRDLRETAFSAWTARGRNGGETDTRAIIAEILSLRHERATLLGYESFADFKLEKEMAKTPDTVRDLLMQVWAPAKAAAERDAARLEALIAEDGHNHSLAPHDWRFYAEKLRKRDHDLDAAEVKPYLSLDAMIAAQFDVAGRLFGLTFEPIDVPLHHPDARAWEVRKGERHMGVFIGDYFARPEKRSGAWCSGFRSQRTLGGEVRPITINVCNFAKAEPALLTWDDARTLFHEFGHALHNLMSDVTYPMISGTSVARDFVELPSQLYEHWLSVPDILRTHARHVETGAPMPVALVEKILGAETFDQGFATVEYLASALVDLDFHDGPPPVDPMAAQAETLARLGMPDAMVMRHAAPHFQHIFAGDGYSSGYYSYMWSEVMDADAFAAFEETGDPFNPNLAAKLLEHVYSAGGSRDPEALYTAFRGQMPGPDALLKGRGLAA